MSKFNLASKTIKGLVWSGISSGLQTVIHIVVISVLSRILTPEDYGIVSAAMLIISLSNIFAQIGIGPALIQKKEVNADDVTTAYFLSIGMGIVFFFIIFFSAGLFEQFIKIKNVQKAVQVLSFLFIIGSFRVIAYSLLSREMNFRYISNIEWIAYAIGDGLVAIICALLGLGFWALVIGSLVKTCILAIAFSSGALKQKHSGKFNKASAKSLFRFSGGFTLSNCINYFALNGDYLITGRFLGGEALGLYTRAYNMMKLPATLYSQIVDKVIFPAFSRIQNDKEKLGKIYMRGVTVTALIGVVVSIFFHLASREIILLLLGSQWEKMITPFSILSIGMYFRVGYKIPGSVLRSLGMVYTSAIINGVYAVLIIVFSFIGKDYGLAGISLGVTISIILIFFILIYLSFKACNLSLRNILFTHLPALLFGGITYATGAPVIFLLRKFIASNILVLLLFLVFFVSVFLLLGFLFRKTRIMKDIRFFIKSFLGTFVKEGDSKQ
ncbi:MAG: lipopolysaccharide biosynthesis protein [Spirochaetales bacterium]|nr:lipopolysaccharide biosynthesis protein [Spirochaetales bacterium]